MNLTKQDFLSVLFIAVSPEPTTGPGIQQVPSTCLELPHHQVQILCRGLWTHKAHLSRDLNKVREEATQEFAGQTFQAESTARAKALGQHWAWCVGEEPGGPPTWLEQRRRQRGREERRSGGDRSGHAGSDGPWGELWTFIYLYQTLPRVMGSRTKVWTRGHGWAFWRC